MNKTILMLFTLLSVISCRVNKSTLEENEIDKKPIKTIDILTGYEVQEMSINGVTYNFELNKKLDTVAIKVFDKKFLTKEGFRVGTKWKEIPEEIKKQSYKLSGFAYYVELKSGWNLAFCIGKTCTDNVPKNSSEVTWIEKRMHERVKNPKFLFENE